MFIASVLLHKTSSVGAACSISITCRSYGAYLFWNTMSYKHPSSYGAKDNLDGFVLFAHLRRSSRFAIVQMFSPGDASAA
jgi:hypothetical protein